MATEARPYTQKVWMGDMDRLVRLQNLLAEALASAHDAALSRTEALPPRAGDSEVSRLHDRHLLVKAYRLHVSVSGPDDIWIRSGDLASIFEDVDVGDIHTITMDNDVSEGGVHVSVELVKVGNPQRDAVHVQVSGADAAWVADLHDALATLIAEGQPWWRVMRNPAVSLVTSVAAVLTVLWTAMLVTPIHRSDTVDWLGVSAVTAIMGALALHAFLLIEFPALVVGRSGTSVLGARRAALIATAAVLVVCSVVLPLLLLAIAD